MGKKQFCFFQTAEAGNRTPDSGVKGSGANHYPRAPAQGKEQGDKSRLVFTVPLITVREDISRKQTVRMMMQPIENKKSENKTDLVTSVFKHVK